MDTVQKNGRIPADTMTDTVKFLAGTYAPQREESLFLFEWDPETGVFRKINAFKGLTNPSWFVLNRAQNIICAAEEDSPEGRIAVIRFEQDRFELLQEISSQGSNPCFVSLNEEETELLAANYANSPSSGSISVYALRNYLLTLKQHEEMHRSGPNQRRQSKSHLHSIYSRNGRMYCCDLGGDVIDCFRKDEDGTYRKETEIRMPAGSGPRHILFPSDHEDLFYVICELDGYLRTVQRTESGYEILRETDTLPAGTVSEVRSANRAGAIAESSDGQWIFVSNRGTDTITMLRKDKEGILTPVCIAAGGAEDPRDIAVSGHYLLIGHQKGKKITVLKYTDEGMLADTGSFLDMPVSPVCISMLKKKVNE